MLGRAWGGIDAMFLNHRALHYYSYLALEIIKYWGESKGVEEGGSHQSTWNLCLQLRDQSWELLVICTSVVVFRQMKVSRDLFTAHIRRTLAGGPRALREELRLLGPPASPSSCLFDVACTILSSSSFLWYISTIPTPFSQLAVLTFSTMSGAGGGPTQNQTCWILRSQPQWS